MRVSHWQTMMGAALIMVAALGGGCSKLNPQSDNLSAGDAYLRDMIPHHEGAVEWAKLVLERGQNPQLRELGAATLKGATEDIEAMQRLLGPGKSTHAHSHGGDHFGPAGIAQIRRGVVDDKLLLDWMIDHHQVGSTAGHDTVPQIDNPEIKALVESMNGRLDGGLTKMRTWRAEWYGS
jgi:uncharacterized protein (DUF305 family)